MKNVKTVPAVILLMVLCFSCFSGCLQKERVSHNEEAEMPLIAVSILPQEWFVHRIGGGKVRTLVLAGQGQNPHNYEPSPRQIGDLAKAAAWILSGAEFEESLRPKIERLFPSLPVIDGTAGVAFRQMDGHDDEGGAHSPHDVDRHTWLGSGPAKILAAHIRDLLSEISPAEAKFFSDNHRALVMEIDAEFDSLRREAAFLQGKNIFVYHPSFGYFLDEFGIKQQAVETGGKSPGPRDLSRLIALAKQEQPAAIFVQAQFPAAAAKTVAGAAGAQLVSLDPLAPDWLANIRRMGEALKSAHPTDAACTGESERR